MGFWNTISVAMTYATLLQAGILNGLNRELPFNLGAGNDSKSAALAGTGQTFTVAGCIIAAVIGMGAAVSFAGRGFDFSFAILVLTVTIITTFYTNYLNVTFRSKNSFMALGGVQIAVAMLSLITVPILYFWGYEGMLWRMILLSVAGAVFLHLARPMKLGFSWDWTSFKELLATGLPIFALSYVESSAGTFDRLALFKFGGVEQVGYYSLGLMVWQGMNVIPMSLTMYFYPRMTFHVGRGADSVVLWRSAFKATLVVIILTIPMIAAGWFLLPVVVPFFFPKYIPGIYAAQLLMWAAFFSIATIGVNILWSMKAWRYMAGYQLSAALFKGAGPFIGALLFSDLLEGVACGVVAAYAAAFIVGLVLTYIATHRPDFAKAV